MTLAQALASYRDHPLYYQERVWTYEQLRDHCQGSMKAQVIRDGSALWWRNSQGERGHGPVIIMARVDHEGHRHHELRNGIAPTLSERVMGNVGRLLRGTMRRAGS